LEQVDARGEVIVTQLFYDVDVFLKFVNDCRQTGITVPIVLGIMPIQNYRGFIRMTQLCNKKVPAEIMDALEPIKDNKEAVRWITQRIRIRTILNFELLFIEMQDKRLVGGRIFQRQIVSKKCQAFDMIH